MAEFLVANALGLNDRPRVEWGSYDLKMHDGTKIEVKSSAYLQSWRQKKYSTIRFGIARTKEAWDAHTGKSQKQDPPRRIADIYVFCLLKHRDKATVDPLNTEQWEFFVVPTFRINEEHSDRRAISLEQLERVEDRPTPYCELAATVTSVAESICS